MENRRPVNEDLQRERGKATFDPEKLSAILYRGETNLQRRRYLENIVFNSKYLKTFPSSQNLSREQAYDTCVKKSVYILQLCKKLGIEKENEVVTLYRAAMPNEETLFGVHRNMFIPTLEQQGTKEQRDKYVGPAKRCEIIGTYAQTELGHGTFLRGIETTATYDPATEEFVINSPTKTSMKYWPGILGKTSNHAVVMAQLYTGGKRYGMHAFIVQLRSLEDHTLLPGVQAGDIGNKLGFNGLDNGYLMFDHHRVPRTAMLMKNAQVKKDGTYVPPTNMRLSYGVMVYIRCILVRGCGMALGEACTIATRYSAVRHQSEMKPGGPEPQILDYQTQQQKLFPNIATAYALLFTGSNLENTYARVRGDIDQGKLDEVQVLHAVSSGLKALAGYAASDGVDRLRMACGGHGYTHASGLPKIFANITPACTYEGENTVMNLQCGRFLLKCYTQARAGKALPSIMSFLNKKPQQRSSLTAACQIPHLIEAYEHVAARLTEEAAMRIQSLVQSGMQQHDARNKAGVFIVNASQVYSQMFVVQCFYEEVSKPGMEPKTARILQLLCTLYAITGINDKLGEYLKDGFLSSQQVDMITNKMVSLLEEIRPDAVTLVDAFDFPDQVLQSCLGRYDGQVYDALYQYAKNSPLNKTEVTDSYHTTLRPLMKGTLNMLDATSKL